MSGVGDGTAAQAALAQAYDSVPYDSQPYADARPAYLAGLGVLHGLPAALPSACRVLELGCASGGHLIPLAWHYPDAYFVGIDLSPAQIHAGQEVISALNLRNCELHAADLSTFAVAVESFDYVVAHGVYSWVPESVRGVILPLCRRALRPGGIAYVSYNTLPGWRTRGLVRDLLDWHLRGIEGTKARLSAAWEMFQQLAAGVDTASPNSYLEMEVSRILSRPPSYLAHEYLEPDNHALLLHDFVARAGAAGLRYLCNADLSTGHAESYGAIGAAAVRLADDPVSLEQYLDFVSNRAFRQTLLCRDDEPPTALDHDRLEQLYLVADLTPPNKLDLRRPKGQAFRTQDGYECEVHHPLSKAALAILHEGYPSGVRYADLMREAAQRVATKGDARFAGETDAAFGELFGLTTLQQIEVLPESPGAAVPLDMEYPCANALARQQAALDWSHVATRMHRTLELDSFARALLGRLDGSAHRNDLPRQMLGWLTEQHALGEREARLARPKVEANTRRLLKLFARHGLLQDA